MKKIIFVFVLVALLFSAQVASAVVIASFSTTGTTPSGITVDAAGNIYTSNEDSNNVSKITPAGVSNILGTTGSNPVGITIDAAGNLYTANNGSHDISKITPEGVSTIFSVLPEFAIPRGITIDAAGNLYTDTIGAVYKTTPEGVSTSLGATGSQPYGITIDKDGNIYVANSQSNNVSKFPFISSGVYDTPVILGTTGVGAYGITTDAAGNVYTANFTSANVTKITPAGVSSIFATVGSQPKGMTIDGDGNLYVTNSNSTNVSKITPAGVSTIIGTVGFKPQSIVISDNGSLYIANYWDNSVSKISGPTLTEVSPVPDPTTGDAITYTFNSNNSGTIAYGGLCSSDTSDATYGDNSITFDPLPIGTYNDCTITVTDDFGPSNTLLIPSFSVEVGHDATVTSDTYTVSTEGGGAETITVPYGTTSKADFLAALTKNQASQTWNDTHISDPIRTGDTLVVTAEDGTTTITYTITIGEQVSVSSCTDFENINNDLNNSYILTTNLDCTSEGSNIMVGIDGAFTGTFDGQNHTITVAINARSSNNVGLFSNVQNATISNLNIAGVVHGGSGGGYQYAGALVGFSENLDIDNVTSSATVSGDYYVGGLIGYLDSTTGTSTINKSSSSGNVSGANESVGGLIGYTYTDGGNIDIIDSHSTGAIDGDRNVGGLIGYIENYSQDITTISNSYSTSSVIGYTDVVGGLIGNIYDVGDAEDSDTTAVNISNSYHTTGNVFEGSGGGGGSVGGLIGDVLVDYWASFSLTDSYAEGTVYNTTNGYVGGLIGNLSSSDVGSREIDISRNHFSGSVSSSGSYVGGLIGYFYPILYTQSGATQYDVIVSDNYTTGTVSGASYVGGLIGYAYPYMYIDGGETALNLEMDNNYSTSAVTGIGNYLGGLVGYLYSEDSGTAITKTLSRNYFTGTITSGESSANVGGLIGYVDTTGGDPFTISDSYTTANVSGYSEVGGLIGYSSNADISDSYATGNVTGSNPNTGGLVGTNLGVSTITSSYAAGNVTGSDAAGGLAGSSLVNAIITKSYATGNVNGNSYVGGLVGLNRGTITDVYAMGTVTGSSLVGGLVGINRGPLTNGYATGLVTGDTQVGGLVGMNNSGNGGSVTSAYYDELTGQTDTTKGTLTTTALMKTESTFTDWNFTDIWGIDTALVKNDGYPYFDWELYPSTPVASPSAGTYTSHQTVTLTSTNSTSIRYSTTETPADCTSGTLYSSPISVTETQTIYARACNNAGSSSPVSFYYRINTSTVSGGGGGGSPIPPKVNPPSDSSCHPGDLFSSSTGLPCPHTNETVCPVGDLFSSTTGLPCTSFTTDHPSASSGPSACTISQTLRFGNRGDQVKCLQTILNITSDGIFGLQTKAAVIAFQKLHNLVPDGIVGPKTRAVMFGQ